MHTYQLVYAYRSKTERVTAAFVQCVDLMAIFANAPAVEVDAP